MRPMIRNTAMMAALVLLGACVSVGRIQQTEPVRTTKFTGSHKVVAQCIQQRIGGKVQDDSFGEKYVIYNSVKGQEAQGLTHYAITVARTGANQGIAEWRIVYPASISGPEMTQHRAADPGGLQAPPGTLTDAAVQRYWGPVEDCVAGAKSLK